MRIAVFTDVHANLTALRAVLDDVEKRGPYDHIVSAGDQLSGGPRRGKPAIARQAEKPIGRTIKTLQFAFSA